MVLRGEDLGPIAEAVDVARRARTLVRQNFALAALYNLTAIPLAALGLIALGLLLWALASGQYDDPEGDAARILLDDDP